MDETDETDETDEADETVGADRRIGGSADRRIGGSADRRIGGSVVTTPIAPGSSPLLSPLSSLPSLLIPYSHNSILP
jgi:hypothetical protein